MRRTATALASAAALLLAGCSGGAGEPGGRARIRVQLSGGEGEIKAAEELVAAFEKARPDVDVELVPVAQAEEHVAKLTAAFAAGSPPDVFLLNYRRLGSIAARGVVDPPAGVDESRYFTATVDAFRFDGKLLCLPQNASSMVVYYNTTLFAQTGVAPPKAGWTWDDLRATARAVHAKGVDAIGFDPALIRLAPLVWSNGGEFLDDPRTPTKVTLGGPAAREALDYLIELQRYGIDATDRAAQGPEDRFAAGTLAMYLDSRRAVPNLRKTEGLEFDVAPVPAKKTSTSVLHSDGYCVARASKHRAAAHAFAEYAVGAEGGAVLARSGRTVPSLKSLAESDVFLAPTDDPKSARVFVDALPRVRPMPSVPNWNEAEEAADKVLEQLFAGRTSVAAAIAKIEGDTARELAAK